VAAHDVSIGTGHRIVSLLQRWGVVEVRNGRPSMVLPCPEPVEPSPAVPSPQPHQIAAAPTPVDAPVPTPQPAVASSSSLLRLDLVHLGTVGRTVTTQADPHDFATLQRLLADAVRRAGGDRARIGEYELAVHLADQAEPLTTVVMAA